MFNPNLLIVASLWVLVAGAMVKLLSQCPNRARLHEALIVGITVAATVTSPYLVSWSISDSLEYVTSARSWIGGEGYCLHFNGIASPTRFPPFNALVVLAPWYLLFPTIPGASVFAMTLFAGITASAAFRLGGLLGGKNGAILAGLTPLLFSGFRHFAGLPMGEIPQIAIGMIVLLAFFSHIPPSQIPPALPPRKVVVCAIGILISSATGLRPTGCLLLLPWLWLARKQQWPSAHAIVLLVPLLALAGATGWYNYQVFKDPWRTGYQYWVAIPYEVWSLTLNAQYISRNVALAVRSLFLGMMIIPRELLPRLLAEAGLSVPPAVTHYHGALRVFFCLWALPTIGFYLCYFFFSDRFFLSIEILFATALVPLLISQRIRYPERTITVALATLALAITALRWTTIAGIDTEEAAIRAQLPAEGIIVSNANPLLFELVFRTSPRQVYLPLSRAVEFASKIEMTTKPSFSITAVDPLNARSSVLLSQPGAKETFPVTADERPTVLQEAIAAHRAALLFIRDASQPPTQLAQDKILIESLVEVTGNPDDFVRSIVGLKGTEQYR